MLNGYFEIVKALDKENLQKYGETIFKQHLTSWIYTIVLSELNDSDKFELFEKSWPIFDKYYTEDLYFKGKYNKIINAILDNKFEKAVKESNKVENISNKIFNKIKRGIKHV